MSTERRLFVDALPDDGGVLRIRGDAASHARVLRLSGGDELTLLDGRGGIARATVVETASNVLVVDADARQEAPLEPWSLTVIQAMPRVGKLDDMVRAAVELGATELRLALSERSQVREDRGERRRERLEAIVREASRQSERPRLPQVRGPRPLLEHAAEASGARLVFCGRTGAPLGDIVGPAATVVVGPEGGLSETELGALDLLGFRRVSLGPTVLRVETALVAALAVVSNALRP